MADGSAQDDATVVKQARMGSTLAFGTLVERYERGARVVAIRATTDHHSADDAVQQAFVKAFERLSTLRDDSYFGGWLMRIVAREACSLASNRKQHAQLHDDMLAVSECESSDLDAALRLIVQLLGKLTSSWQNKIIPTAVAELDQGAVLQAVATIQDRQKVAADELFDEYRRHVASISASP